jgi:hypothetical protein
MNSMMLTSFDQLQSCRVYMSSMMLTSFNYLQSCTAAQLDSFMKCEVTFFKWVLWWIYHEVLAGKFPYCQPYLSGSGALRQTVRQAGSKAGRQADSGGRECSQAGISMRSVSLSAADLERAGAERERRGKWDKYSNGAIPSSSSSSSSPAAAGLP